MLRARLELLECFDDTLMTERWSVVPIVLGNNRQPQAFHLSCTTLHNTRHRLSQLNLINGTVLCLYDCINVAISKLGYFPAHLDPFCPDDSSPSPLALLQVLWQTNLLLPTASLLHHSSTPCYFPRQSRPYCAGQLAQVTLHLTPIFQPTRPSHH